jgi:hypothetical protein
MKRLLTIGMIALSFALPPALAQDQQQQQQQQEVDPAQAEAAMQAAAAALEAAAAERAALEAQQQQMGEPPGNGEPATQPVAAAEEQPEATPQPSGPTSRPTQQQQQRNRFKRRMTTTQPAVANRPAPKPPRTVNTEFAMLLTRSIFMKGPQRIIDPGAPGSAPATRPIDPVAPEHNLVFNGVTEADATTALVEDTAGHKVNKLHVGDAIASGKVTGIDFDSIEYTVNGKSRKIEIGQNLEGTVAAPTSGPAVFGASGGTSGSSGTSGGGSDSILEKMRQRRMQGK